MRTEILSHGGHRGIWTRRTSRGPLGSHCRWVEGANSQPACTLVCPVLASAAGTREGLPTWPRSLDVTGAGVGICIKVTSVCPRKGCLTQVQVGRE